MKTMKRKGVAIFFAALLVANFAQAGEIKGKVSATGLKSAENIAVYIDAIPGKKFDRPVKHSTVDQRNMLFVPRTLVILKGDNVAHNVFWPSINGDKRLKHNLTIVSPNQTKTFEFNDLGAAQLLCNLHPDMIGYVVVVPTPYFALTASDGTFSIKDVPPGTYTLKTWSEDGKPTSQAITATDAATNVEISVKK